MSIRTRIEKMEGQLAPLATVDPDGRRKLLALLCKRAERFAVEPPTDGQIMGMAPVEILALVFAGHDCSALRKQAAQSISANTLVGRILQSLPSYKNEVQA